MHDLPGSWSALCTVVFLLGIRHGLDADHLAAIDGMTRLAQRNRRGHASSCGLLFSLGHGAVVLSIAGSVGLLSAHWALPAWLDVTGSWISILFLATLGCANLRAAWTAGPDTVVGLVGFKSGVFGRIVQPRGAWTVALVGGLFALSLDTLSQAALFAIAAGRFGGLASALGLGSAFVAGMTLTDGLNGWWVSRVMACSDRTAARAARWMAFAVAASSLGVAAFELSKLVAPSVAAWSRGSDWTLGLGVVALIGLTSLVSRHLALRPRRRSATAQL